MLRYEVKLGKDNLKQEELVWSEKYLAPDLSFISGVTDVNYHLEKFQYLAASNSIINSDSILGVDAYNVTREGYVIVKEKAYDVLSGVCYDYSSGQTSTHITYYYTFINGRYFYWKDGKFSIDNWQVKDGDDIVTTNIDIQVSESVIPTTTSIKIDTIYWIEDGIVNIDGSDYIYDKNEGSNGILKYLEGGMPLDSSAITDCDSIEFYPYDVSEYSDVTKFSLTKQVEVSEPFDRITFSRYYYYIKYKNHYCPIIRRVSGETNDYWFVCEIPTYVVSGQGYDLTPKEYKVYYSYDIGNENGESEYRKALENNQLIDKDHYDDGEGFQGHGVKLLNELKNTIPFVYIDDDDICVTVEYDIVNSNFGDDVAIYLENPYAPMRTSEKIELVKNYSHTYDLNVYTEEVNNTVENESEGDGDTETIGKFVFFNGRKYEVEKNICDKALIDNIEYDIEYISGKTNDAICLVDINGEQVPMLLSGETSEPTKVKRLGKIVVSSFVTIDENTAESNITVDGIYDIVSYDGVVIDEIKYAVHYPSEEGTFVPYVVVDIPRMYTFVIDDIIGSSTYICKPFIDNTDFSDNFRRLVSEDICSDVVENQTSFELQIKNKVFGEMQVTKDLAFRVTSTPTSSSDYYDLFSDLKIYVNSGYIHIPLSLVTPLASNLLQDDIVKSKFFEAEEKKAINKIVDMEKDVYSPKYIESDGGKYSGSSTTFKPIDEIVLNFHFRTRNLDNWKVNYVGDNAVYSADTNNTSLDNWFVTDFYPYKKLLGSVSGETLQSTSDLIGLLNFDNNDVFYQKKKLSQSFARLSFYDSTDPQTQSLLATSTVYLDGHSLFKKFMDNSRKNIYEFGLAEEVTYERNGDGQIKMSRCAENSSDLCKTDITTLRKFNKISVSTEFLGKKKENIPYSNVSADCKNIKIDEDHRISSRMVIKNKYASDNSSEGFYLYIFREYSENLHPKPIYMKIEFNHAGIGRTIPFVIPMHWSGDTTDKESESYNKMYPQSALTLASSDDIEELKKGIPLSYVYAQTYVPLYAVYDFQNNEYCYVFDSRYVNQVDNGVVNLNLFELKIQDESDAEVTPDDLEDIKLNRQKRAIININEEQFDKKYFNYKVE